MDLTFTRLNVIKFSFNIDVLDSNNYFIFHFKNSYEFSN